MANAGRRWTAAGLSLFVTFVWGLSAMTGTATATSSVVSAWGTGTSGQLGDGFESNSSVPVAVSGLSGVKAVSAGGFDSMALLADGTVKAWGANGYGQLGDGTTDARNVPVTVTGLEHVTAIASGFAFNLALLEDGTVEAWGYNYDGELGDGTTADSHVPVKVSGLGDVTAISADGEIALAVLGDGTVKAWGEGALGNGAVGHTDVPVTVGGLSDVKAVAAGGFFNLALLGDGTVEAWGTSGAGGAGVGDGTGEERLTPVAVCAVGGSAGCPDHLDHVTAIAAGGHYGMALLEGGTVVAWGHGPLGDGTETSANAPVALGGLENVTAISMRLALLEDGTVETWGSNVEGHLGNPDAGRESLVPVPVSGLTEATAIAAGGDHSLAVGAPPPPTPQVVEVSPEYGPGGGGESVGITGINLVGATAVEFGTADATAFTVNSPTSITATAPPGTGTVDVTVTTAVGTSPVTGDDTFRYSPAVRGIAPKTGYPAGGTPVVVTGTNFGEVTAVKFGPTNATSFTVDSPTEITAVSPAGTGTADVVVETTGGSSPARESDRFTYSATPLIEAVTPNHGPPAGGTQVTIKGSNFTDATSVRFGSRSAAGVTVRSPTEITATTPEFGGGEEDAVGVFVTTPAGTNTFNGCGTSERGFVYEPTITSVEPGFGPAGGGTEVTIHGIGFKGVIKGEEPLCTLFSPVFQGMRFGSEPATDVNIVSGTEMTAVAPPGAGTVDITLLFSSSMGSSATGPDDRFTYAPAAAGAPEAPITEACMGPIVGGSGQKLCGTLNPHTDAKVGYFFAYNVGSTCEGGARTPIEDEVEGEAMQVSAEVTGLAPETEYAYCLVATGSGGETVGDALHFTTGPSPPRASPSIGGEAASQVTATDATLEAEIDTRGPAHGAFYQFQLFRGPGEAPEELRCPSSPPAGFSTCVGTGDPQALPLGWVAAGETKTVKLDLQSAGVGLEGGQTYFFRLLAAAQVPDEDAAEWESPAAVGATEEFTTPTIPSPPTVLAESATEVEQTTAGIEATVDPGSDPIAGCEVEYGPTDSYGSERVCSFPSGAGLSQVHVTASLSGLTGGSTYHFRIVATGAGGTGRGADQMFTTRPYACVASGGSDVCGGSGAPIPKRPRCAIGRKSKAGRCARHRRHRTHRSHHRKRRDRGDRVAN